MDIRPPNGSPAVVILSPVRNVEGVLLSTVERRAAVITRIAQAARLHVFNPSWNNPSVQADQRKREQRRRQYAGALEVALAEVVAAIVDDVQPSSGVGACATDAHRAGSPIILLTSDRYSPCEVYLHMEQAGGVWRIDSTADGWQTDLMSLLVAIRSCFLETGQLRPTLPSMLDVALATALLQQRRFREERLVCGAELKRKRLAAGMSHAIAASRANLTTEQYALLESGRLPLTHRYREAVRRLLYSSPADTDNPRSDEILLATAAWWHKRQYPTPDFDSFLRVVRFRFRTVPTEALLDLLHYEFTGRR